MLELKSPQVTTINLAKNGIRTLKGMRWLPEHAIHLVNLSFDGNLISDFAELDHLKVSGLLGLFFFEILIYAFYKGFSNLRELVLTDNPISSGMDETRYRRYDSILKTLFTSYFTTVK